jgi:hypothetical protein
MLITNKSLSKKIIFIAYTPVPVELVTNAVASSQARAIRLRLFDSFTIRARNVKALPIIILV